MKKRKNYLSTEKVNGITKTLINPFNRWFNDLNTRTKKVILLSMGITVCSIGLTVIIQALSTNQEPNTLTIDKITTPKDIHMSDKGKDLPEDQLIPVGKLKGEVNGEFEAFYLAVDKHGQTYINRSLEYSDDAYSKSKGWEQISRQQLEMYEKQLHFIPARGKGLKL
ncbi:hypothetical protein [Chryseolinea sp. H1M3-3]|uniref:hypothetical protein n=1 Tax=Chryseolinea sp. H1M3-3 TaxID=3034144 RepID=UPI0023EAD3EE|nr:hypothetical protein [Chryseolinea sp. H1M3-3]